MWYKALVDGIIVIDHGSRRAEANAFLLEIAKGMAQRGHDIVEAAHMELAEPTLAAAFRRCVERGATRVVVLPFFLSAGRHTQEDIPRLAALAASEHPGVPYAVASPLGTHPLMLDILASRLAETT